MGLPFAPNSVPLGTNPGGKRLTTRIHRFGDIEAATMVLTHNPYRFSVDIAIDQNDSDGVQITLTPDVETSWTTPQLLVYNHFTIYGTNALYARKNPVTTSGNNGIILFEHVYE